MVSQANFPYQLLCDSINHRIILTDLDLKVTYTNGPFLGNEAEYLIGEVYSRLTVDPSSSSEIMNLIECEDMKPVQYKHKNNHIVVYDTKIVGFPDHKDIKGRKGYLVIVYDLSHATNYKMRFMSNISHEIRTPLIDILGVSQLLENTNLDSVQVGYLKTIQESGSNLLSTFNNILDMARLESNQVLPNLTTVKLHKCVEESIDIVMSKTFDRNIVINHNLSNPNRSYIPNFVITDYQRLQQILVNIIGNAIKFTSSKGEVNIQISAEKVSSSSSYVRLINKYNSLIDNSIEQHIANEISTESSTSTSTDSQSNSPRTQQLSSSSSISIDLNFQERVDLISDFYVIRFRITDNGIGIDKKDYCNLFKPFVQSTSTSQYKGTGLGLALSKKFSNLLFGDIWLEKSVPGEGSTFIFEILAREITKHKDLESNQNLKMNSRLLENKTALVIDDEPINRVLISNTILQFKMTPVGCSTIEEALMYLNNKFNVDIIIINISKKSPDSLQDLLRKVKEKYIKPIPLMAISNHESSSPNSIFQVTISKPITPDKLGQGVLKALFTFQAPQRPAPRQLQLTATPKNPSNTKILVLINFPTNSISTTNSNSNSMVVSNIVSKKSTQKVLREMLNKLGYQKIDIATTSDNAFHLIKQASESAIAPSYNLVIMNDPESNINLAKKVKKDKKIKRKPKIVLMLNEEQKDKYNKYLTKETIEKFLSIPVKITSLKSTLDSILKR